MKFIAFGYLDAVIGGPALPVAILKLEKKINNNDIQIGKNCLNWPEWKLDMLDHLHNIINTTTDAYTERPTMRDLELDDNNNHKMN